jgi:hypothetical protein
MIEASEWNRLFHGTSKKIEVYEIRLDLNALPVDFGNGFYTTPVYEEAVAWAEFKEVPDIVINEYSWDIEDSDELAVKIFSEADKEWFYFVKYCRENGNRPDDYCDYDVIIGPVATDIDYELFLDEPSEEFFENELPQIIRFMQIVFCTRKGVSKLKLEGVVYPGSGA